MIEDASRLTFDFDIIAHILPVKDGGLFYKSRTEAIIIYSNVAIGTLCFDIVRALISFYFVEMFAAEYENFSP